MSDNKQHTFNCVDYIGKMAEWSKVMASSTSHFDRMGSTPTPVMLHCYKLTILLATKPFENNKQHTFNCIDYIGRMAEWSKELVSGTSHFDGVGSNPTPVMLHCYKLTVLTAKNNSKIINNIPSTVIDYICRMAEWSKVLVSGTSHFDGMGSNPTLVILHCYKLTVLFGKKQFENNQQHSFNCIVFIGRMAEWSKAPVSGTSHFDGVGSDPTSVMLHHYKLTVLAARK